MIKEIDKKQVVELIKKYYEKNYLGQAIKVRVETRKKMSFYDVNKKQDSEVNKDNVQNDLFSNYNLGVENLFVVMGYLEQDGYLHKFAKRLDGEEIKMIMADALDEDIDKIEMKNKFKYSVFENDKIGSYFSGIKIYTNGKEKVLSKKEKIAKSLLD